MGTRPSCKIKSITQCKLEKVKCPIRIEEKPSIEEFHFVRNPWYDLRPNNTKCEKRKIVVCVIYPPFKFMVSRSEFAKFGPSWRPLHINAVATSYYYEANFRLQHALFDVHPLPLSKKMMCTMIPLRIRLMFRLSFRMNLATQCRFVRDFL